MLKNVLLSNVIGIANSYLGNIIEQDFCESHFTVCETKLV